MVRIVSFVAAAATLSLASVAPAVVPAMQASPAVTDGPLVTSVKPAEIAALRPSTQQPAEATKVAMRPNDGQSMLGLCMSAGGTVAQCVYWRLFL